MIWKDKSRAPTYKGGLLVMGQGESLRGWQVALMGHIDVHGTNISGWEINLLYTGATPLNHVLVPVISCNLTSTYIYICIIMYVYI